MFFRVWNLKSGMKLNHQCFKRQTDFTESLPGWQTVFVQVLMSLDFIASKKWTATDDSDSFCKTYGLWIVPWTFAQGNISTATSTRILLAAAFATFAAACTLFRRNDPQWSMFLGFRNPDCDCVQNLKSRQGFHQRKVQVESGLQIHDSWYITCMFFYCKDHWPWLLDHGWRVDGLLVSVLGFQVPCSDVWHFLIPIPILSPHSRRSFQPGFRMQCLLGSRARCFRT